MKDYIAAVKRIKVQNHLTEMLNIDPLLYGKIMDTDGFAFHFSEITKLARGDFDKLDLLKKKQEAIGMPD